MRHSGTDSLSACELFLQGRELRRAATLAKPPQADALPERAVALDPDFAPVHGALACLQHFCNGLRTFLVPDFTSKFFFMTMGNLQLNPRAGVLFIDFDSGELLTLAGTAAVGWRGPEGLRRRRACLTLRFAPAQGQAGRGRQC